MIGESGKGEFCKWQPGTDSSLDGDEPKGVMDDKIGLTSEIISGVIVVGKLSDTSTSESASDFGETSSSDG